HLRYSFTVLFCGFVENWLPLTCDEIAEKHKYVLRSKELAGKPLAQSKRFLKKIAGLDLPERLWLPFDFTFQVRNQIVHAYGDLTNVDKNHNLRQRLGTIPGYQVVDERIILETEFATYLIKSATDLFQELFKQSGFKVVDQELLTYVLTEPTQRDFWDSQ